VLAEISGHVDLVGEGARTFEQRYWAYTKAFPLGDQVRLVTLQSA
jgi:hypothetical protein